MRSVLQVAAIWLLALLTPCKDGCCPHCGWETTDDDD